MSPSAPRTGHASGCERQLILKGLVVVLSTWFVSASGAHAQTAAAQRVVVRSYNTIGLPLPILDDAESTVGDLLREAGIDSSWRNCRTTDGPSSESRDLCGDVVNASEVIVRIVRAPRAITDVEVLGYSHVDAYLRRGTLATVFADRVRVLAAALRIDQGTLLGRAITHEVGHLLLGTLEHSEAGLMRGAWNTARRRRSDWLFSSAEATRMRAGLEARSLSPPLAVARAQSSR
jgi:hypothetical protein